jgi:hypothetical protein
VAGVPEARPQEESMEEDSRLDKLVLVEEASILLFWAVQGEEVGEEQVGEEEGEGEEEEGE